MTPKRIAYAELFAGDHDEAVGYLTEQFAFRRIATAGPETGTADRRSTALANGGVTMIVTTGLDDGSIPARFVAEHGDGIGDLALGCADVRAAFTRAVEAGAQDLGAPQDGPGGTFAVVSGFGDVRHTLITEITETLAGNGPVLAPDRVWAPVTGSPADRSPTTEPHLIDHAAVVVPAGTLKSTVDFYAAAFDVPYYSHEYIEVGGQAMDSIVVRNEGGGITLTLIEPDPTRDPGQIDRFLDANAGAGVQHLAFLVDDAITSVRRYGDLGVRFLKTPETYYDMLVERIEDVPALVEDLRETNLLVDRDDWGYLLQIFTRSPYARGTLFYELIERDGARGFGASNIKALYEAVERSRATAQAQSR